MDELVDILDSDGNATGHTALKSEAHENGWYHPSVHIWFFTEDKKVLIQQRAKNKDTFPLIWDVSVAGHIGAGEPVEEAAMREINEEIGLKVEENDLQKIGVFKATHKHSEILIDKEFHHLFLCRLRVPLAALKLQKSEVADLQLVPLFLFSEETWGLANLSKYVPHGTAYYKKNYKRN